MDLLIDIGNSRVKWATHDEASAGAEWFFAEPLLHGGDYQACISPLWKELLKPGRVALSCVASSAATSAVVDRVDSLWGMQVRLLINTETAYDINSNYADRELGVDRWLVVIGARSLLEGNVAIADFGSAVNIEFLTEGSEYLGGMILPGRMLMYQSLAAGTAMDLGDLAKFDGQLGESTDTVISAGVISALTGALEKSIQFAQKQHKREWRVIITGGDSKMLAPYLSKQYILEPNLVFIGMSEVLNWQG
ncbi:MAG: type III pantothenate kinase [Arenicellaceae bacterium]|nr:type III pantothenate kinase [Arenicellaceae bacterium]